MDRLDSAGFLVALAAASTLFCCLPAGWLALALALEARRRVGLQDESGARLFRGLAAAAALLSVALGLVQWGGLAFYHSSGVRF